MAGIGSAPCRPVAAEDIRDLQRWTGHRRSRLGGRRVFPALVGLPLSLGQQIEWALDLGNHAGCNTRVARGGVQFVMTQQRLNHANVRAAFKQMGREAVAKRMQRERFTVIART